MWGTRHIYLFIDEVAERLNVKPEKVYRWLRSGMLEGHKKNGFWRVDESYLERWMIDIGYLYDVRTGQHVNPEGKIREVVSVSTGGKVQYLTPGGATRYCSISDFRDWMKGTS